MWTFFIISINIVLCFVLINLIALLVFNSIKLWIYLSDKYAKHKEYKDFYRKK